MTGIRITDHAILRYLERVGGFDIARLRDEIGARIHAKRTAGENYVLIDGVTFVVRDDDGLAVVTTVLPRAKARRPRKRRKGCRA